MNHFGETQNLIFVLTFKTEQKILVEYKKCESMEWETKIVKGQVIIFGILSLGIC